MSYSVSVEAAQEIADAVAFYRKHASLVMAQRFLAEFERAAAAIDVTPGLGAPIAGGRRIFPIHRFPYSLIYRTSESGARIVVVAHQRRRPGYWRGRK